METLSHGGKLEFFYFAHFFKLAKSMELRGWGIRSEEALFSPGGFIRFHFLSWIWEIGVVGWGKLYPRGKVVGRREIFFSFFEFPSTQKMGKNVLPGATLPSI